MKGNMYMLINCPECNKEISEKAEICPNCGYRLPKSEPIIEGVYCPSCLDCCIKGTPEFSPVAYNKRINYVPYEYPTSNIPKCPTCGSLNVEKISTGKKIFGGAMFGLFSSDVRNTMHCKNCGAKW